MGVLQDARATRVFVGDPCGHGPVSDAVLSGFAPTPVPIDTPADSRAPDALIHKLRCLGRHLPVSVCNDR